MIKYYTSSTYRKHYSDLEKLNMLSEKLDIEPYQLSLYVLRSPKEKNLRQAKSPSKNSSKVNIPEDPQKCFVELLGDLDVYRGLSLTPIKAFKSLLLIHCTFLLVKTPPSQENVDKLNSFFKWILEETVSMIQKFSYKESIKRVSSIQKGLNFISKSAKSLRSLSPGAPPSPNSHERPKSTGKCTSDQILSKEICLLSSIVKPYILYLQKILSIYSYYQSLIRSIPSTIQSSTESAWTVLNLFKLMAPIVKIFVYVGRYFFKEYSQIVELLIQFFSKQVNRLYPILRTQVKKRTQKIEHQWFVLHQKHSQYEILHSDDINIEGVDDAMLLVDQVLKINDSLFYIYYGKHFYYFIKKLNIPTPNWLQLNSRECEFLIRYVESKHKNKKRSALNASKNKKISTTQGLNLPPSINIHHSPRINQINIEKKNIIPKVKNTLKLGSTHKETKDEAITFRIKQSNGLTPDSNKIFPEISFGKEESTEGSQNLDSVTIKY